MTFVEFSFDKESVALEHFHVKQDKQIIVDLGDDLSETGLPTSYLAKIDIILGNIACHRSIRSGRNLNISEMNQLLREMEKTPNSGQCNHGRPTSINLSIKDIEKLFNRT